MWRIISCGFLFAFSQAWAQHVVVHGNVKDADGDVLPFAHVINQTDSLISICDENGRFSLRAKPGPVIFRVSFTGYETLTQLVRVSADTSISFVLSARIDQLEEVVVTGQKNSQDEIFESTQTSSTMLSQNEINAIPVLGGEADVIKALQLLPGTIRGIEGTADLFVRGGAADQNLVLLDNVPIYNTSHLFGFLSVFNPDIIESVEAINGGFPADYGGRLSSVLDIKTSSDLVNKTSVSGDIGTLAARFYVETPIAPEKVTFWMGGRRTYVDQVVRLVNEELPYFFYDLNAKVIYHPSHRDELTFSYYTGDDLLDYFRDRNNDGDGITTQFISGNDSQSFGWKKNWMNGWKSNLSLMRTSYRYEVSNSFEDNSLQARSVIEDYGAKFSVEHDSLIRKVKAIAGVEWTQHEVNPVVVNTGGYVSEFLESSRSRGRVAHQFAFHVQGLWSAAKRLQINSGLRLSMAVVNNVTYKTPEPRLALRYSLDKNTAIKLSYSRMAQYMHRVSSSAASSPTDIWYPVTPEIAPQTSDQFALAWQRRYPDRHVFLSAEAYYKTLDNLIGYEEGTNLFFNTDFESRLVQGRGEAYGMELLLKKEVGKFTGWISYTLSWSTRQFDAINHGREFFSRYDRRHNGAVVAQYALNERWRFSMVFEYVSGSRFTPVIGQYTVFAPTLTGVDLIPVFSDLNGVKLADSHRLDLGIKYRSKADKKFQWEWFAGLYNAYNRANPIGITIHEDETTGTLSYQQPGLFGLIPFLSYGFKF